MTTGEAHKKWKEIFEEIQSEKSNIDKASGEINQIKEQLNAVLNEANKNLSSVSEIISQIQGNKASSKEVLGKLNESHTQAANVLSNIKETEESIRNNEKKLHEAEEKFGQLLEENKKQAGKIQDMLQKAAAGSLFHSFNLRKAEHASGAELWAWMIGISVVVLTGEAIYIAWIAQQINVFSFIFLIRLAITFPSVYWLIFSTRQYIKARNFEEEYGFKSAISLSLEAYRDLLKKESVEETKGDVIPFITDAVSKIFSSPRSAIVKNPQREDLDVTEGTSKFIEKLTNFIKEIKLPINIEK